MDQIERTTIDFLQKMQVLPHYKGYQYIKDGVRLIYEDRSKIHAATKQLYPAIAELHGCSMRSIEHGIRSAHENASDDDIKTLLHLRSDNISNVSFLAALTEAVRLQINAEGPKLKESE